MRRTRKISFKECYSILELSKDATLEDVKRAYRRRAFELHPDLNPGDVDAVRKFQMLNEAYVALSQVLQTEQAGQDAQSATKQETQPKQEKQERSQTKTDAQQEERKAQNTQESTTYSKTASQRKESENKTTKDENYDDKAHKEHTGATHDSSSATRKNTQSASSSNYGGGKQRAASAAYAQEDVLRDLLNDPFARRVFEDIYSEVNRQAKTDPPPQPKSAPEPPKEPPQAKAKPEAKKVATDLGMPKLSMDFSKGVKGVVKSWLRRQIDEEQTMTMPASHLRPGARIRLQIRRGLSEDLSTIEITLPPDFVVGKPVRLRGLGKKVGQWQGDLYLTLQSK